MDDIARTLIERLKKLLTGKSEQPEDPDSPVGVRNKPKLPHLSGAAVAELPED